MSNNNHQSNNFSFKGLKVIIALISVIPFVIFFIIFFIASITTGWPVNVYRSFFQRFDVTGKVERVGGRFVPGSRGSHTKINFQIRDGRGQVVSLNCDDTRCSTVHPGDDIQLSCFKQFHIQGSQEIECRWGKEYEGY